MIARWILGLCGFACAGYGVLLLSDVSPEVLLSITVWFGAGIVVHDAVFAPLVAVAGLAGRRILPRTSWAPVTVAVMVTFALAAVAGPVLYRSGAVAGNDTVLDRNYGGGLVLALIAVWTCAGIEMLRRSRRPGSERR